MSSLRAYAVSLVVLLSVVSVSAQPKRGRPGKPDKVSATQPAESTPSRREAAQLPPAADEPGAERVGPTKSAPANPSGSDLGAPPAASGTRAAGPSKLSPLNPAADEFPRSGTEPAVVDLDRLLSDVATLRSRVAALTTTLFKSRLRVTIEVRGDDARIESLGVTLDDGVVFAAPERFSAEDERVVYEHAVAPGQHVVGVEIERYDLRSRQYRSWQSSKFSLIVPESRLVEARFVIEDDSDMAAEFPSNQDGEYELRVRLRARVVE